MIPTFTKEDLSKAIPMTSLKHKDKEGELGNTSYVLPVLVQSKRAIALAIPAIEPVLNLGNLIA